MSRLITNGNIAVFEYPTVENPEFTLDEKGVLFIFGYKMMFGDNEVGVAKRFDLKLDNYMVIGKYGEANERIEGNFEEVFSKENIDTNNSVVLIKK